MISSIRRLCTLNINTATALRHRFHRRLSEWHMAGVMLLAGVTLMIGPVFDLDPFAVVKQIAEQQVWAVGLTVIGAFRLMILIINGAMYRGSPHLRSFLASVSTLVWSIMLAGLLTFGTPLLIGPFLAMAVLVDLINAFRAAQDARNEDDECGGRNGLAR